MLTQILTALALVLVIEGLLPSIAPAAWKNAMRLMIEYHDDKLRQYGLVSMIIGALILVFIH